MTIDRMDPANYGPGHSGEHITWLGQRLLVHGFGKHYSVGPGPVWGESDRLNVQDFQLAQGWKGTQPGGAADGLPGKQTLTLLSADPVVTDPELKTGLISYITDSRITESSALARSWKYLDLAYTMNDEGQSPQVYGIQISTGKTDCTFDLKGIAKFKDPESISINAFGQIALGDIGDNDGVRKDCAIVVLNDPGPGKDHGALTATRYPISYVDGPRNAESLLIHPTTNEHFVITKEKKGRLYAFGSNLSPQYSTVGRYVSAASDLPAYATDATFSVDGKWVFVRAKDKQLLYIYNATTWKKAAEVSCPKTTQGESVTAEANGKSVIIGSEGKKSPLYRVVLPQAFWVKSDTPPEEPPPTTPQTLPSKILDLKNWKLTLPLPLNSHTSATEVKQPDLASFRDARYFHVDSTGTGVVFNAPVNGATTSNSGYPRSELREMNGSALASWSNSSGTHTMTIKQAITHRPDVKKHVVAGQIHDASDDVLMIRLEDKRLFVEARGVEVLLLDSAYVEKTVFTVVITAVPGAIYVRYNDGLDKKALTGTFKGCYFKAGCYTQSNLSKGDKDTAYGEVVIYSLKVEHV